MSTMTKLALAAALVLGAASAASANDNDRNDRGGYQVQTWQQIGQDQRGVQRQYHTGNAGSAFGYVVSPKHTHRASHE